MTRLRIGSIPAVRRARMADALVLAVLGTALAAIVALGFFLHPLVGAIVLSVGVVVVASHLMVAAAPGYPLSTRGAEQVLDRASAPVLWDAVHECAVRAGVPPPKIYLLSDRVSLLAGSWGFGADRAIGVQEWLIRRTPSNWVKAAVAHEIAHHAMGDLALSVAHLSLRTCLQSAAWILGITGFLTLIRTSDPATALPAFIACAASVPVYVGIQLIDAYVMPHVRYRYEHAADAVGVAITGDPISAMGLMIFFATALGQQSRDPRPHPGGTHPPPIVRAARIFRDNKDAFFR